MENMPTRVVFIKTVKDNELKAKQIDCGTIMDTNMRDLNEFSQRYPGCFSIIEMREEDWIKLATENFANSKAKLDRLTIINEALGLGVQIDNAVNYLYRAIPEEGKNIDPRSFGGGLSDVYNKSKMYKAYIDEFERAIEEKLSPNLKNKNL